MTNQTTLLPCRFCGAEGKLFVVKHPKDGGVGYWPYATHQSDCPLRPGEFSPTEAKAIAAWNRRATGKPPLKPAIKAS